MCTTCGCGDGETRVDGVFVGSAGEYPHEHRHDDGTTHPHWHRHEGGHSHVPAPTAPRHRPADGTWHSHDHAGVAHVHESAAPPGGVHEPDLPSARIVRIEQDILARNDAFAAANRRTLADRGIFALNLVSSPGSGKTTLLVRTIEALQGRMSVCVIEGDQQTSLDADRIRATGAAAVQVNTGKGCHLDARMVGQALAQLAPPDGSLLLVENVGNLVCPAAFDLGEAHKVVILSVTEGEDKPLKYPDMFRAADLMLVNKIDLLPYVQFDVGMAVAYAQRMKPGLAAINLSATSGEGFTEWLAWLERGVTQARARRDDNVAALRQRGAELEGLLAAAAAHAT